jgi:hypothetical protein
LKPVFADPTARWVPFATAGVIVAATWGGIVWNEMAFGFATQMAIGLAIALLIGILLQGRLYWRGEIAELRSDGTSFEASTSTWVGRGRLMTFRPHETSGWVARPKTGSTTELSSVAFETKGQKLEMSFLNPQLIDLAVLSQAQPIFFAQLKRDYPTLTSLP